MAVIEVPKPPQSAHNPDRPMGALLRTQVEHMHVAEKQLPSRFRQQIDMYPNALRTEGEAAEYIRRVTEAIHAAHADVSVRRPQPKRTNIAVLDIAASAETAAPSTERASRKRIATRTKAKAQPKAKSKPKRSPRRSASDQHP